MKKSKEIIKIPSAKRSGLAHAANMRKAGPMKDSRLKRSKEQHSIETEEINLELYLTLEELKLIKRSLIGENLPMTDKVFKIIQKINLIVEDV